MLKDIILWQYKRGTWQYDVFCLLIVAFIFLTPKSWFDRREQLATQTARPVVKPQDFSPGRRRDSEPEKIVKLRKIHPDAEIVSWTLRKTGNSEIFDEIYFR
jgi:hypothetical protein